MRSGWYGWFSPQLRTWPLKGIHDEASLRGQTMTLPGSWSGVIFPEFG
jgi:hypothetical protein